MNKKVTTHTFRHTHITLLVEMNVSFKSNYEKGRTCR